MEENQSSSLFEMEIDNIDQSNLISITKWTRFISITVFVFCGLMLLLFLTLGDQIMQQLSKLSAFNFVGTTGTLLIVILVVVLGIVVTWIYFLFRASQLIKQGVQAKNPVDIAEGFKSLKIYFVIGFVITALSLISTLSSIF